MIRRYQAGDETTIARIFHDAIYELACGDYTPEELNAWASRHADSAYWKQRCEAKRPFVKELDGQVAGFIEFDPDGHIDCTYVDPKHAHRGVMTEIMEAVKREAVTMGVSRLFAEVSKTARPFFERNGFVWVSDNLATVKGVSMQNYIMQCDLNQVTQTK